MGSEGRLPAKTKVGLPSSVVYSVGAVSSRYESIAGVVPATEGHRSAICRPDSDKTVGCG
jgi:hypothetical protein